jgi:hypothetical protein
MPSRHDTRHDTTRVVLFYGTGRLDFYSLYVRMPHAVSHILHHAQVVRQIGCLSAVTTKIETMYFLPSCYPLGVLRFSITSMATALYSHLAH